MTTYHNKYKKDIDGNYIGYHLTDIGNTLRLKADRVLWVCHDPTIWFPNFMTLEQQKEFELLQIHFHIEKEKVFNVFWEYIGHNPIGRNFGTIQYIPKELQRLIDEGYDFISLYENDRKELQESCILNPLKSVVKIKKVS